MLDLKPGLFNQFAIGSGYDIFTPLNMASKAVIHP
jgi:hypothetical protein